MARLARVVIPGMPHHIVQRGVRSLPIFPTDRDRKEYLDLLALLGKQYGVEYWAWCLMSNHIHLVAVPESADSLARAIGEAHRRYTRQINLREGVRGHLFQERFHSFPVETDSYLTSVIRYVETNPIRAGLAKTAEAYRWSSARYHVKGEPDPLVKDSPIGRKSASWRDMLRETSEADIEKARLHTSTGRPLGGEPWVKKIEKQLGVPLIPRRGGWPKGKPRKPAGRRKSN
jgi:putative transposase